MLKETLQRVFTEVTINELRLMNGNSFSSNLSYNSLLYLDIISYRENCTASYIADALHISKSAVTVKINELMKQGYIEKIQNPGDKRIYYLRLKEEASQIYRIYDDNLERAIQKVMKTFTPSEIAIFCKVLDVYGQEYQGGADK